VRTALLLAALLSCQAPHRAPDVVYAPVDTHVFTDTTLPHGPETYSAWFADTDGRVLYFGLSPFWDLWWRSGGDARADLQEPGDHLIGRFDLDAERFLSPLRVRPAGPESRGSVWDVLVHSNGRIYYTTYFEEIGSVNPEGSDVRHYAGLGSGFNEIVEGPDSRLYVTRYSNAPADPAAPRYGAVVVLSPQGDLVREHRLEAVPGRFVAPKSLDVDPASGEIWVNTDTFEADGRIVHETLRLAPDGRVLERRAAPELHFVRFDARGRTWLAESGEGALWLRVLQAGRLVARLPLGAREPLDFVQEIRPTADGGALLAFWSSRVVRVVPARDGFRLEPMRLELPPGCRPPQGRSLLYTAVAHRGNLYATLFCGATVLRASLPE
jgi:hypothetical protein